MKHPATWGRLALELILIPAKLTMVLAMIFCACMHCVFGRPNASKPDATKTADSPARRLRLVD